jgi:hypothetical protein
VKVDDAAYEELVEPVARAMCAADNIDPDQDVDPGVPAWCAFESGARSTIANLRAALIEAGFTPA